MAVAISLSTFNGHKLTAQDHALIIQTALSQSGIFYGVNVTLKDENTLHITTGEGVACGRVFRVTDMDYPVELSASGTLLGRLYVHIDTALQETPAQIMDVQGASLPALVQETDMNEGTGVYEIELATFTINELGISDLVYTAPKAQGGSGGDAIAPEYKATESYVSGQMFFYAGKLYKAIAAIPVGGPIVENTNVVETSIAAEIFAVNQNLTNCLIYNQTDDWIYIGSEKWKKAFLQSLVFFTPDRGYNADTFGRIETVNAFDSGCYAIKSDDGVTIEDNDIVFQTSAGGPGNQVGVNTTFNTPNAIDLTQYDKLYMKGFLHSDGDQQYFNQQTIILYIQLVSKSSGEVITIHQSPNRPRNLNVEWNIDISQYSGEYYLRYRMRSTQSGYNGSYLNAKFENIHFS